MKFFKQQRPPRSQAALALWDIENPLRVEIAASISLLLRKADVTSFACARFRITWRSKSAVPSATSTLHNEVQTCDSVPRIMGLHKSAEMSHAVGPI